MDKVQAQRLVKLIGDQNVVNGILQILKEGLPITLFCFACHEHGFPMPQELYPDLQLILEKQWQELESAIINFNPNVTGVE